MNFLFERITTSLYFKRKALIISAACNYCKIDLTSKAMQDELQQQLTGITTQFICDTCSQKQKYVDIHL